MDKKQIVVAFWKDVAEQNAKKLEQYFSKDAIVNWHNTNESFFVSEYIIANCEYPDSWNGEVERIEILNDIVVTVTRVWNNSGTICVHATSFFEFCDDKITLLNEYWGDDGVAPQWRVDKRIGKTIKCK